MALEARPPVARHRELIGPGAGDMQTIDAAAETAARERPGWRYWPEIDGLRAIAVLAVLLFHFDRRLLPGGFVGVDVFFVISGYLIAGILLTDLNRGTFSLGKFYQRRIARIAPAFFVVLGMTLAGAGLVYAAQDRSSVGADAAAAALSVINFKLLSQGGYFAASPDAQPLLHYWSLAVEEQFYLVFPVALYAVMRFFKRPLTLIGVAAAASLGLSLILTWKAPTFAFYLLPPRAWELLAGAALALWRVQGGKVPAHRSTAMGWAGIALILLSLAVAREGRWFPGLMAILPVAGTGLVLAALIGMPGRRMPILSHPVTVFIGTISYSLYLWHWPIFSLVDYRFFAAGPVERGLLKIGLTLAGTLATFFLVERPGRAWLNAPRRRWTAFAGFAAAVGATMAVGLYVRSENYLAADAGSLGRGGIIVRGGRPTVALIGDSQAGMYGRDLAILARRQGFTLYIMGGPTLTPSGRNPEWQQARAFLARTKPDVIIVSELWSGRLTYRPDLLDETMAEVGALTHHIVLTTEQPLLPPAASRQAIRNGGLPPFFEESDDHKARAGSNALVRRLAGPGVDIVDVDPIFALPGGAIRVIGQDGRFLYHDERHLASPGTLLVRPVLGRAIEHALAQAAKRYRKIPAQ